MIVQVGNLLCGSPTLKDLLTLKGMLLDKKSFLGRSSL